MAPFRDCHLDWRFHCHPIVVDAQGLIGGSHRLFWIKNLLSIDFNQIRFFLRQPRLFLSPARSMQVHWADKILDELAFLRLGKNSSFNKPILWKTGCSCIHQKKGRVPIFSCRNCCMTCEASKGNLICQNNPENPINILEHNRSWALVTVNRGYHSIGLYIVSPSPVYDE